MIVLSFRNIRVYPDLRTEVGALEMKLGDVTIIEFNDYGNIFRSLNSHCYNENTTFMNLSFLSNKVIFRFSKKDKDQKNLLVAIAKIEFKNGSATLISKQGPISIR